MQSNFLKSTTAMVLAIAVAAPSPMLAQDSQTTTEELKKKLEQAADGAEGVVGEVTDETVPAETDATSGADATATESTTDTAAGADATATESTTDTAAGADATSAESTTDTAAGADATATESSTDTAAGADATATEPTSDTATTEPLPDASADGSLKAEGSTDAEVQTGDTATSTDTATDDTATPTDTTAGDTATSTDTATGDTATSTDTTAGDTATTADTTADTATGDTATTTDTTTGDTATTTDTATGDAATTTDTTTGDTATSTDTATGDPATSTDTATGDTATSTDTTAGDTATTTDTATGDTATSTDTATGDTATTTDTTAGDTATAGEGTTATGDATAAGEGSTTEQQTTAEAEAGAQTDEQAEAKSEPSQETLSGEAPEVQAAQAGSEEGELVEETVTEDTSRSSDEEFDTKVDEQAKVAEAEAQAEADDDDDGLSTAQKIAIGGLGALAIGALLNNGQRVVSNSGDRVVVDDNGTYRVLKNDDSLLRQPGADVKTYSFSDGSTRTVVTNADGSQVETIRASDGRVLSRTRVLADGREVVLFDDTKTFQEVTVNDLPQVQERRSIDIRQTDEQALRDALQARLQNDPGRSFSLAQVRNIQQVRALAPEIEVNTVNFDTGSAVIRPEEAEELAALGAAMKDAIEQNPGEVFLVEGHTDAVGGAGYNLALSDRRAESLALALTEYFAVPPENMIVQGYGESDLKVETATAEQANRRAAVRRITPLLGERS